jgi:hypothetical protein
MEDNDGTPSTTVASSIHSSPSDSTSTDINSSICSNPTPAVVPVVVPAVSSAVASAVASADASACKGLDQVDIKALVMRVMNLMFKLKDVLHPLLKNIKFKGNNKCVTTSNKTTTKQTRQQDLLLSYKLLS